jgi:hypothetical protein
MIELIQVFIPLYYTAHVALDHHCGGLGVAVSK